MTGISKGKDTATISQGITHCRRSSLYPIVMIHRRTEDGTSTSSRVELEQTFPDAVAAIIPTTNSSVFLSNGDIFPTSQYIIPTTFRPLMAVYDQHNPVGLRENDPKILLKLHPVRNIPVSRPQQARERGQLAQSTVNAGHISEWWIERQIR